MIIDHIGVEISDYKAGVAFYKAALAPLEIELLAEYGTFAGFGKGHKPEFWIGEGEKTTPKVHVAFIAKDRATVDRFYQAAIKAGGKDNGKPGIREIYHPHYYGAFVLCPDGHNIEAVCHDPA